MPAQIRNIIFDLGGVLLHINPSLTLEAFRELGMPFLPKEEGRGFQHPVFIDMEQGHISNDDFRKGINDLLPKPVSNNQIDLAWNAMLLSFDTERIEYLKELRQNYRIFLFSNTNEIHAHCFQNIFFGQYQHSLPELFEQVYYSHDLGLRKPKPEAFAKVLRLAKINAEETLFIDDLEENCKASESIGMRSLHLNIATNIKEALKPLLS